jgi:protein-disulfide isomerase
VAGRDDLSDRSDRPDRPDRPDPAGRPDRPAWSPGSGRGGRPDRPGDREPAGSGIDEAARLASRSRRSTVLLVVALVVIGIAFAARSQVEARKGPLVRPAHALGPSQGEQLGSPSAPVLVEEYGDFQCPVCARFQATTGATVRQLVDQGQIRFVFHEQPILGRESVAAANAATCAGDAGRFWQYHDLLYAEQAPENSGALTSDRLIQLGAKAGVSGDRFASCVRDSTYDTWLRQVVNQGSVRGVNVTPTFYVNGRQTRIDGPAALTDAVRAAGG